MPSPPTSMLLPASPSSVSSKFEPVRFSMLMSVSPSASPPLPMPSHQAHRNARGRGRIARRIDPATTVQSVGTRHPLPERWRRCCRSARCQTLARRVNRATARQRQVLNLANGMHRIG